MAKLAHYILDQRELKLNGFSEICEEEIPVGSPIISQESEIQSFDSLMGSGFHEKTLNITVTIFQLLTAITYMKYTLD